VIATLTSIASGNSNVALNGTPANLTATANITDNDSATVSIAKTTDGTRRAGERRVHGDADEG